MKKGVCLFIAVLFCAISAQAEEPSKNILVIIVDDLGYHDLGFMGSSYYESPNIDQLAQEGIVFSDGYAACMVCSPSRVSLMTGQTTARHGVTDWIGAKSGEDWRSLNRYNQLLPPSYVWSLPEQLTTLPEAMREEGYTTFFTGKWHMGYETTPEEHGFDYAECRGGGSPKGGYYAPFDNVNIDEKYPGENLTMRLAEETVDFMTAHKDEKFFAYLSFHAVHSPIETTKEKWKKYRDKADDAGITANGFRMDKYLPIRIVQDNPIYAGLIESMDEAVGYVLEALEDLGLDENTAIIFTSDNGGVSAGDAYSTSNLPLRMGKGNPYEGGFRVPFLMKVPWLEGTVSSSSEPVVGMDIYPTVLDLVGASQRPEDHKDGVSLVPLLMGEDISERGIFWHYPHYANQGGEPASIIRKGKWKLIHLYEDDVDLLYDMSTDPGETTDLAASEAVVVQSLRDELEAYLLEVNALKPERDPLYDAAREVARLATIENNWLPDLEAKRMNMLSVSYDPGNDWWGSDVEVLPLEEKVIASFEDSFVKDASSVKSSRMSEYFSSSGILHDEGISDNPLKDDVNPTEKCYVVEMENFKWDNNFVWMLIDTTPSLNWNEARGVTIDHLEDVIPLNGIEITDDNRYLHVMHYRSRANNGGASVSINSKHLWKTGQGVARFDFSGIPAGEWVDLVCDLSYFRENHLQLGHITVVNSTQWGDVSSTHPDYLEGSSGRFVRTTFAWDELVLSSRSTKRKASVDSFVTEDASNLPELQFYPIPFNGEEVFVSGLEEENEVYVFDLTGKLLLVKKNVVEPISFDKKLSSGVYVFCTISAGGTRSFLVSVL